MMTPDIKAFYDKFNFADMVTGNAAGSPPKVLADFFEGDVEYITNKLPRNKNVLEIGCGFGRLLGELSKVSKHATGIDFSRLQLSESAKRIENLTNVDLRYMHAEHLQFPDGVFDVVACLNSTLGNMPGIETEVVQEMARVVRPGGLIVVRVFANTPVVRDAQFQNYQRLNLTNIRDDGNVVTTNEGFYSRRFSQGDLFDLFSNRPLTTVVTKDGGAGYLVEATKL